MFFMSVKVVLPTYYLFAYLAFKEGIDVIFFSIVRKFQFHVFESSDPVTYNDTFLTRHKIIP